MDTFTIVLLGVAAFTGIFMVFVAFKARRFRRLASLPAFLLMMAVSFIALMCGIGRAGTHVYHTTPVAMKTWEHGSGKIVSFVTLSGSDKASAVVLLDTGKTVQLTNAPTAYNKGEVVNYGCIPTSDQTIYRLSNNWDGLINTNCLEASTALTWVVETYWQPLTLVELLGATAFYLLVATFGERRARKAEAASEPIDTVETL